MPRDAAQFFRRPEGVTPPAPPGDSSDEAAVVAAAEVPGTEPIPAVRTVVAADAERRAFRPGISTSGGRIGGGRPKWRWRRETPRPVLPGAPRGSGAPAATVESRSRMLSKLRRELEIWQWRRAVSHKGPDTK